MNVLVTYASRHGATKGIAERVAATLERNGCRRLRSPLDRILPPLTDDSGRRWGHRIVVTVGRHRVSSSM
jgi:flavodoxin